MTNDILRNNYSAVPDRLKIDYRPILTATLRGLLVCMTFAVPFYYSRVNKESEICAFSGSENGIASCIAKVEQEQYGRLLETELGMGALCLGVYLGRRKYDSRNQKK